ncbi:hypothetical protein LZ31DRAFT_49674 [Colletotrichum somersetense]|nr:hypothetical protein LZ31DRAFT_49674 [Colletotrichum somersetense]
MPFSIVPRLRYSSFSRETRHHLALSRPKQTPKTHKLPPRATHQKILRDGPPPHNDPHPRASIPRGLLATKPNWPVGPMPRRLTTIPQRPPPSLPSDIRAGGGVIAGHQEILGSTPRLVISFDFALLCGIFLTPVVLSTKLPEVDLTCSCVLRCPSSHPSLISQDLSSPSVIRICSNQGAVTVVSLGLSHDALQSFHSVNWVFSLLPFSTMLQPRRVMVSDGEGGHSPRREVPPGS